MTERAHPTDTLGAGGVPSGLGDLEDDGSPVRCDEFLAAAAARGDTVGLVWRQASLSYRELAEAVSGMSAALRAANAGNDPVRVGVALPNRPAWIPLLQAIWDGRGQAVLISSALPARAVIELAAEEELDVLVVPSEPEMAGWESWERGLVTIDETLTPASVRRTTSPGLVQPSPEGPGVVLFTSGTTGRPKPIPISNAKISGSMESTLAQFGARLGTARQNPAGRANVVTFPLYHISGLFLLLFSVGVQRPVVLLEKFTVEDFVGALERAAVNQATLTPTMIRKLLDSPDEHTVTIVGRLASIRSGAAPLSEATRLEFESRFGVPILQGYGATETVGEIAGWTLRDRERYGSSKGGSVGRPHRSTTVEIRDPAGGTADLGTVGEVWVKGPTTAEVFVRTSDLGYLDEDGFLFLAGRGDDVINCGGFKILPAAVERAVEDHPAVKECAVVGEPDDVLGQVPVAYVVPGSASLTTEEILRHARDHLPPYQCPRRVHLVAELPRNDLDKIVRRALPAPEAVTS